MNWSKMRVATGGAVALLGLAAAAISGTGVRAQFAAGEQLGALAPANIARSRADALAWCVRLVGRNTDAWLTELRDAMSAVDEVRANGPDAS